MRIAAILVLLMTAAATVAAHDSPEGSPAAAAMRQLASEYYRWKDMSYPVVSSDAGLHSWDAELTDYSEGAYRARRQHVEKTLGAVRAIDTSKWCKDDRIDWHLLRAQLEWASFQGRVLNREETDPQVYVNECSNSIFSLLKKEYAPPRDRALAAIERMRKMPAMIEQGKRNLKRPVGLYARFAIESARSIDPMFVESLAPLAASLSPADTKRLEEARKAALASIHGFANWLEARSKEMVEFRPMGEETYDYLLRNVYLLPFDARDVAMLGESELARYRALESWLPDPKLADPDPRRLPRVPADQAEFLKSYESRQDEMIRFLEEKDLITLPPYLGPFYIRPLPDAFKPTSPGGFMNAPGIHDKDPSGFYFITTYDPKSPNFYVRAAIEEPRPILGHEGIPGHFLQISIANHVTNEIRRRHDDGVFVEGWALYGEEMLARTGLYPAGTAGQGQVLRLSRYRSARIGTDVNLHTGKWTFEEGVRYFMEAGGLDRVAAEGETAGAASEPSQKITYIVGKWQIQRLLGKYRDAKGDAFRLGRFHDELLANGSLPLSIVEWILLDDPSTLERATGGRWR
jgi:uncharacterized protein (DUF885 family)